MNNYAEGPKMPLGLGMALAQNIDAMNHFASFSKEQQQQIIDRTHSINSKQEMQDLVRQIGNGTATY